MSCSTRPSRTLRAFFHSPPPQGELLPARLLPEADDLPVNRRRIRARHLHGPRDHSARAAPAGSRVPDTAPRDPLEELSSTSAESNLTEFEIIRARARRGAQATSSRRPRIVLPKKKTRWP